MTNSPSITNARNQRRTLNAGLARVGESGTGMANSGGEAESGAEGKACTSPGSAVLVEVLSAGSATDRVAKP